MAVTINGSTGVQLDDNDKQEWGTGDDLQVYHDGSNSYLANTTGVLVLQGNGSGQSIKINPKSGENSIVCVADGATNLYYDNSKKFETTSSGVSVTGILSSSQTSGQAISIGDTAQINLGTGDDFRFYHNATNSYIENSTGNLIIDNGTGVDMYINSGNDIYIRPQGAENGIKVIGNGGVELYEDNVIKFKTYGSGAMCYGHLRPGDDDTYDLGINGAKWDDVYATNGTIQTSDRNEKNTIVDSDLGLSFVNKLKPVSYKFNGKTRTHYGLISQDIETVLSDIGKPSSGFAGFIKEDDSYGLRYNEFISPLIKAVQELSAEVETLKTKVAALEAHTHE